MRHMGRRRRSPEGTIRRLPGLEQKGIWLRPRGAAASVITRADALTSEGAVGWLKAAHAKAFAGSIQRLVGLWVCFGKSDRDRCETDAGRSSGVRGPGLPHARPPGSTIECSSGSAARLPPYGARPNHQECVGACVFLQRMLRSIHRRCSGTSRRGWRIGEHYRQRGAGRKR